MNNPQDIKQAIGIAEKTVRDFFMYPELYKNKTCTLPFNDPNRVVESKVQDEIIVCRAVHTIPEMCWMQVCNPNVSGPASEYLDNWFYKPAAIMYRAAMIRMMNEYGGMGKEAARMNRYFEKPYDDADIADGRNYILRLIKKMSRAKKSILEKATDSISRRFPFCTEIMLMFNKVDDGYCLSVSTALVPTIDQTIKRFGAPVMDKIPDLSELNKKIAESLAFMYPYHAENYFNAA